LLRSLKPETTQLGTIFDATGLRSIATGCPEAPSKQESVRVALIAIPLVALLIVPAFIASTEPRIFGMPPIMWWLVAWIALTPFFLLLVERLRAS
jgi:hypothetical protein